MCNKIFKLLLFFVLRVEIGSFIIPREQSSGGGGKGIALAVSLSVEIRV